MVESPVMEQIEEQQGEMGGPEGTDADLGQLGPKGGIWKRSSSRLNGKPTFFLTSIISGYSPWAAWSWFHWSSLWKSPRRELPPLLIN
jgi:hypothetical protein